MVARGSLGFSRLTPPSLLSVLAALACAADASCGEKPVGEEPVGEKHEAPAAAATEEQEPAGGAAPARASRGSARVSPTDEKDYESSELGALHGTILFKGKAPERF